MSKTIEILSIGTSLAALFGAVIVVDWPLIRAWWVADNRDAESLIAPQDQIEYMAAAAEMHEAGHTIPDPTGSLHRAARRLDALNATTLTLALITLAAILGMGLAGWFNGFAAH